MSPEDEAKLIARAHKEIHIYEWFDRTKKLIFSGVALLIVIVLTGLTM